MVVGLCGNDSTMTRGLGQRVLPRLLHVLEEVLAGAHADLADVGTGEQRAPDVDRVATGDGTSAASPGWSSTHIRWEKPSLAPMVEMTSVSGSSVTPNRRW